MALYWKLEIEYLHSERGVLLIEILSRDIPRELAYLTVSLIGPCDICLEGYDWIPCDVIGGKCKYCGAQSIKPPCVICTEKYKRIKALDHGISFKLIPSLASVVIDYAYSYTERRRIPREATEFYHLCKECSLPHTRWVDSKLTAPDPPLAHIEVGTSSYVE